LLVASLLAAFDISPVEDDDDEYDLSKVEFTTGLVRFVFFFTLRDTGT
jgi:hypothetical protein